MKRLILVLFVLISNQFFAQLPCEYSVNTKDSLGTYKSTKEYMVYEKNFAGNKSYIFVSLISAEGTPALKLQLIQKSKDFIKAKCFDKNSRLSFQLNNGKVVTLINIENDNCGTMVRDDQGFDNRLLVGNFMFVKGSFEDLKNSPTNLMRIKFMTDVQDYVFRKEFTAEMDEKVYQPESYFINYLSCIE